MALPPILEDLTAPLRSDGYSLRVSVLSQCNFSCPYCLPGTVQPYTKKVSWLRPAHYARLAEVFRPFGIHKVRFTGGEPLLRDDICEIVAAFRDHLPEADLGLTTNGTFLPEKMSALRKAGVTQVTIHIDTLREERYPTLMGDGSVKSALTTIGDARGIFPVVKLNVVVQRGKNDDELADFIRLSESRGVEVRFIELMNTGSANEYVRETFLSGAECIRNLSGELGPITPVPRRRKSDPAALYEVKRSGIRFGIIASDTQPFCEQCDRIRLTASGKLRGCLYQSGGVALGELAKLGASTEQMTAVVRAALSDKRSYHPLASGQNEPFSMADIGG